MDLKQEIKLSDLVRRPRKKTLAGAKPSGAAPRKRGRKQEIVGLKIGASQIAASRVVNNGGPAKLVQLARVPLEPGVVVAGEVRDVAGRVSCCPTRLFRVGFVLPFLFPRDGRVTSPRLSLLRPPSDPA